MQIIYSKDRKVPPCLSLPAVTIVVIVLNLLMSPICVMARGQDADQLSADERKELEIYRSALSGSYNTYLSKYYQQETELGDQIVRTFQWQLAAANVVLALVVFLSIAGIVLAAYQLWVSGRIALSHGRKAYPPTSEGQA